jgi:hypothetical protein
VAVAQQPVVLAVPYLTERERRERVKREAEQPVVLAVPHLAAHVVIGWGW